MTHAQLEERLHADGLGLLRQLLQDSLDLRASREQRLDQVVDGDGHQRGTAEGGPSAGWRPCSATWWSRVWPTGRAGGPTCTRRTRR
jgi:hypothetical protein